MLMKVRLVARLALDYDLYIGSLACRTKLARAKDPLSKWHLKRMCSCFSEEDTLLTHQPVASVAVVVVPQFNFFKHLHPFGDQKS